MKQKIIFLLSSCFIFFILMTAGSVFLHGADAEDSSPLPKAEKILDKYIEVTGGMSAYDKIHNRVVKGTMDMVAAGIKISMTNWQAKPNKGYSISESGELGKMENGTDGNVVWANSTMTGPQVYEGKHRASMLHQGVFDKYAYWRKTFEKVEAVGIENVAGKSCFKVVATPKDTHPETLFFDKESGLLVRVKTTMEHPMGPMPLDAYLEDYKKSGGILISFKSRLTIMGQEMVVNTISIENNVQMPEDRFNFPAEIQALLDKKKEKNKGKGASKPGK